MDNLKLNFGNNLSDEKVIFKGNKYRITILSDVLIRLEYNENGIFNDFPSLNVINRKFNIPEFKKTEENNKLIIETYFFKLEYEKEKEFAGTKLIPDANLRVTIKQTNKTWYYNNPEARNLNSTPISREGDITKVKLKKGLYSLDGFALMDDSKSYIIGNDGNIGKRSNEGIDIYLFAYGNDFFRAINSYYKLTGSTCLLPKYAFGLIWNKNDIYNVDKIIDIHTKFKVNNIPYSVFLLNAWNNEETNFTFNKNLIPDKTSLLTKLNNDNVSLGLEINPFGGIKQTEENITLFKRELNTNTASIIPFNTFDNKFINAFMNNFINPLLNNNINIFMLKTTTSNNAVESIFNLYLNEYIKKINKRGIIFSKNTDFSSHKSSIPFSEVNTSYKTLDYLPFLNLSSSNNGVNYWSHSIGGFSGGTESPNLFIRFIEQATFSPIFRLSSERGDFYKREPWMWDTKTFEITKKYIRLRYKLIPYLYSLNYYLHKSSSQFITPIYHLNTDIINEPQYKNEYLLGSELLISPITMNKERFLDRTNHKFYLPKGVWYEFNTGNKYEGDKRYSKLYKDEDYPVFIKEGGILPLGIIDNEKLNDVSFKDKLEIHIFPGKNNTFNLFEDDGYSNNYLNNEFIITSFEYSVIQNNHTLIVKPIQGKRGVIPEERKYKFIFRNIKNVENISVTNGENNIPFNFYLQEKNLIIELSMLTYKELKITINNAIEHINKYDKNIEIKSILNGLTIETKLKQEIYNIINNNDGKSLKRTKIRKLKKLGLQETYIDIAYKLLEM